MKYPTPPVVTVNRITGHVYIDFDKDFDFTPEAAERVQRTVLDTFPIRHILDSHTIANMEALAYQLQEEAFLSGELIQKIPFGVKEEKQMSEMGEPSFHVVTWKENERESGITVRVQLVNPDGVGRGLLLQIPDEYLVTMCSEHGEQLLTRFLRRDDMYNGDNPDPVRAAFEAYVRDDWREHDHPITDERLKRIVDGYIEDHK